MTATAALDKPIPFGPNARLRDMEAASRLFVHSKHPEWGVGMWTREEMTRRRLMFEDGVQRAFKKGFYHLLEPVDVDEVDVDAKLAEIGSEHDIAMAEARKSKARKARAPVMSLQQQVRVFKHLYPGGFGDEDFIADHVRPDNGRRLKAHHGESAKHAAELLSREVLEPLVSAGKWDAIHANAVAVLDATGLVARSKGSKVVSGLAEDKREVFARAMFELLYGEEKRFGKRFGRWLATLRKDVGLEPSWGLATVFPGLLMPTEHTVVKPRVFELQGREVLPGLVIEKRPTKPGYKRVRRIVAALKRGLAEHDLVPPDHLQLRTFVWETLRPRGREVLAGLEGK